MTLPALVLDEAIRRLAPAQSLPAAYPGGKIVWPRAWPWYALALVLLVWLTAAANAAEEVRVDATRAGTAVAVSARASLNVPLEIIWTTAPPMRASIEDQFTGMVREIKRRYDVRPKDDRQAGDQ